MTQLLSCLAAADDGARSLLDAIGAWAKVETTWQLVVVLFGLVAQLVFFLRWIVQWIATERRGASHVPESFWWLSLGGASLLFVYYVLRGEPVGILSQSTGWTIYTRNLYLIRTHRKHKLVADDDAAPAAD